MTRHSRFPGLTVAAGLPPTLMILTGHPMLGGATLGLVLLAWVAHTRMEVRARQAHQARVLHARAATPARRRPPSAIPPLPQRPPRDDDPWWDPAEDADEFDPDEEERPWVHLRPTEW